MAQTTFIVDKRWRGIAEAQKEIIKSEVLAKAASFQPFIGRNDDYRHEKASQSGGFELRDQEQTHLLRSSVSDIIEVSLRYFSSLIRSEAPFALIPDKILLGLSPSTVVRRP